MKPIKYLSIAALALVLCLSCGKDFIVKNIKNDSVKILAPTNNLVTTSNPITFWWEALDGAEKYNVQIVKPNFLSVNTILTDTTITVLKFTRSLTPGTYQWRIKAINNGGETGYTLYNLTVDTTSNLTNQLVSTIAPLANGLTGNRRVVFSWNALNAALQYQVVLSANNNAVIKDTTTSALSYTYTFPAVSDVYRWKVRALNNSSLTQYTSPLSFTVDLTPPAVPTLSLPLTGTSVTATSSLSWVRNGGVDVRYDSVYIATDTLFTNVISRTKVYASSIAINALNNAPQVNNVLYWWRVRSVDSVGNRSPFTTPVRKFTLVP